MSNYLVTGARNTPHITSMDDASLNAGIFGDGVYILNRGEKLRAEMTTSNNCRLYDGDLVTQGRHSRIEHSEYVDLTINNGLAGVKRNDLIVLRYEKDVETGIESTDFVVIQGTPAASNPTDPEYNEGNIFDGDLLVDFPIYRIQLDGIVPSTPIMLAERFDSGAGFVKLYDGTLIQYGSRTAIEVIQGQTVTDTFDYDADYAQGTAPRIFATLVSSNPHLLDISVASGTTNKTCKINIHCSSSGIVNATYFWLAIGRWK